ncbi:MAG: rhomboid family intramembrane serine protease [Myxococcota bacterium]|nr:rhomboid family intramembrane serine protease [Myxococcota bacterium]
MIPYTTTGHCHGRWWTTVCIVCLASVHAWVQTQGMTAHLSQGYGLVPLRLNSDVSWQLLGSAAQLLPIVAYPVLHAGVIHIGLNLWGVWLFGGAVEDRLGYRVFWAVWMSATIVSGMTYVILEPSAVRPLIGASGCVAAMLGVCLVGLPDCRVKVWRLWRPSTFQSHHVLVYVAVWVGASILGFIVNVDHYQVVRAAVHGSGLILGMIIGYCVRPTPWMLPPMYDSIEGK